MNNTSISMKDKFKPAEDIVERRIGENMCLYSPSKNLIMSLNQTAVFIFKACNGKKSIKQIIEELSKVYKKVNTEILSEDLLKTISEMADRGFLEKS